VALFLGSSRAIAWIGEVQAHQWFDEKAMPRVEQRIDEKIGAHRSESELRLQTVVAELRIEVEKLKALREAEGD
jgi:hypothetical protein